MTSQNDWLAVGRRLKQAREYMGLTEAQVAAYLQTSALSISYLETGGRIDALELNKLSRLYQRPVSWFLNGEAEAINMAVSLIYKVAELPQSDLEQLALFAEFLKNRRQQKEGK